LPLIAACAGIGIAYVSQTAHGTQATYQATGLTVERDALRHESAQLDDELGRLRSAERIVAAAQQLGMRPAGQWVYASAAPVPVIPAPEQLAAKSSADGVGAVSRVIASFRGTFTSRDPESTP
jgi:cell division protein FtsL